jgi:hypothetical protein
MPQAYLSKSDNGRKSKSYLQVRLEQNLWRCDCNNEGKDAAINKHETSCRYGLWYAENDFNQGDNSNEEDKRT